MNENNNNAIYYTFYKIVSLTNSKFYIGCTSTTLSKRISGHLSNMKAYNKRIVTLKCSSCEVLADNNYTVKVLLKVDACTTTAQKKRELEREFVEAGLKTGMCVNKNIPNRSPKEYNALRKEYNAFKQRERYKNKPSVRDYKKMYYQTSKQVNRCNVCNKNYFNKSYKHIHENTLYHKKNLHKKIKK